MVDQSSPELPSVDNHATSGQLGGDGIDPGGGEQGAGRRVTASRPDIACPYGTSEMSTPRTP